jgi:hypothetical protein
MKKHALPLISVVLAVALSVFAVPAFAGENGGGSQKDSASVVGHSPDSSDAPGNSAAAPGHEKADQAPPNAAAGSSTAHRTAHSQASKPDSPATTHRQAKNSNGSAGVKPSNSTSHNVSAPAGSNATKLYGNGQTAGQIAIANGATADTLLYGPGNSQPHKTVPCGQAAHGNGGGYDVHALKSHAKRIDCTDTPSAGGKPTKDPATKGSVVATSPAAQTQHASDTQSAAPASAGASNGVLGAVASVTGATLPFTGLPLGLAVLVAIAAIGSGLAVRHQARSIA